MMKGNTCTICAENDRNAGKNSLEQHLLTLIFLQLNVMISLLLLVLNSTNPYKMRNGTKISQILALIEVAVIISYIFKSASESHSKVGTAQLLNLEVTVPADDTIVKDIVKDIGSRRESNQPLLPRLIDQLLKSSGSM